MADAENFGIPGLVDFEQIGTGGFGQVYAATDGQLQRRVAVKVLSPIAEERDRRRFDRECAILGQLSTHPNIVTVHSAGYGTGDRPYLVMELIGGGSVADRMRTGPIPWQQAVGMAIPIAHALEAAHQAGILHRDIKPENILLEGDSPSLADFGIAHVKGAVGTASSNITASWLHAAPETFENDRDERSDVYSLASTLFTMVTGHAPFWREGDSGINSLAKRLLTEPAPPLPAASAPPALVAVVAQALEKDPATRPQTAADLARALASTLSSPGDVPAGFTPPSVGTDTAVAPAAATSIAPTPPPTADRPGPGPASQPPPGAVPPGAAPPVVPGAAPPVVPTSSMPPVGNPVGAATPPPVAAPPTPPPVGGPPPVGVPPVGGVAPTGNPPGTAMPPPTGHPPPVAPPHAYGTPPPAGVAAGAAGAAWPGSEAPTVAVPHGGATGGAVPPTATTNYPPAPAKSGRPGGLLVALAAVVLLVAIVGALLAMVFSGSDGDDGEVATDTTVADDGVDGGDGASPASGDGDDVDGGDDVDDGTVDDADDADGSVDDDLDPTAPLGWAATFGTPSTLWEVAASGDRLVGSVLDDSRPVELTDIAAAPDGSLYGSTFAELYRIDPTTGAASSIGPMDAGDVNALELGPDGVLYGGTLAGTLITIDQATAATTVIGQYPPGYASSGDLLILDDGRIVATANDGSVGTLLTFDPADGTVTIAPISHPTDVWGLLTTADGYYAMTNSSDRIACPEGELYSLDPTSGALEFARCLAMDPGGAAPA